MGQKPGGVGILTDPALGHVVETYCSTCAHCQRISEFDSMRKMQEHVDVCRSCMRLVCLTCADLLAKGAVGCVPWEKMVEKIEAHGRRLKSEGWL